MEAEAKKEEVNRLILDGFIPLAFIESTIVKHSSSTTITGEKSKKLNVKYLQKNIPDATSPLLISKIYEFH